MQLVTPELLGSKLLFTVKNHAAKIISGTTILMLFTVIDFVITLGVSYQRNTLQKYTFYLLTLLTYTIFLQAGTHPPVFFFY